MGAHPPPLDLPPLPLEAWAGTKDTLHLYAQIVGKVRAALHPKLNHWWHVTLYVSPRGLTTRAVPYGGGAFEVAFDLIDHALGVTTSRGGQRAFPLAGLTVADFHGRLFDALAELGIEARIRPEPYEHESKVPFPDDRAARPYDAAYVHRFWRALVQADGVLREFGGRFLGKQTPVHLFWHSFDLALTRFSGRAAPPMTGGTRADREAYSHEVVSFGFWAGDRSFAEPAFYSYTYPEPAGLAEEPLRPGAAFWADRNGSALAVLRYEDVRGAADPRGALLEFLEGAYRAGARRAGWPVDELRTPWAPG
ncbi:MAG TPA: DUF5996 family protein [Geminicoccaceae bacterium]|nr:DUF5996 family protein [Geminicoccaceae bacterium]